MNFESVLEQCEAALIELEYASADFLHQKAADVGSLAPSDIEALRSKIAAANLALQIALEILRDRPAGPAVVSEGKAQIA